MAVVHARCPKCGNAAPLLWRIWRGVKHRLCCNCWREKDAAELRVKTEVRK